MGLLISPELLKKWICNLALTLRTFMAFSNFFLLFELFLPVEYLIIMSLAVGPSSWKECKLVCILTDKITITINQMLPGNTRTCIFPHLPQTQNHCPSYHPHLCPKRISVLPQESGQRNEKHQRSIYG